MPYWKLSKMRETLLHSHPSTRLDPRIHDPDYDFVLCKEGAPIFFQTPVVAYFVKERVDTVIVTGCVTSACIRASVIDSFQYKFRTMVPEDCVGDREEDSHWSNLRDIGRRYCDVTSCDEVIDYLETRRDRNRQSRPVRRRHEHATWADPRIRTENSIARIAHGHQYLESRRPPRLRPRTVRIDSGRGVDKGLSGQRRNVMRTRNPCLTTSPLRQVCNRAPRSALAHRPFRPRARSEECQGWGR